MAFVDANGARIAYQQMGEGDDVVLLHGLAANRAFWFGEHVSTLVDAGFRVTLFDLRGHGYSTMTETGYSAASMGVDLLALMDALRIRQAHVIGHSYGGGVALEFAVEHPDRVSSLGLMDTRINRLQPQQLLREGPKLNALEDALLKATPADWDNETQVGLRYLESLARHTVAGTEFPGWPGWTPFGGGRGGKRSATQFVRLLDFTDASREFLVMGATPARIKKQLAATPVLLAYGELSRCLGTRQALSELLPCTFSCTLDGAGHFFPATHREETAVIIREWLETDNLDERRFG